MLRERDIGSTSVYDICQTTVTVRHRAAPDTLQQNLGAHSSVCNCQRTVWLVSVQWHIHLAHTFDDIYVLTRWCMVGAYSCANTSVQMVSHEGACILHRAMLGLHLTLSAYSSHPTYIKLHMPTKLSCVASTQLPHHLWLYCVCRSCLHCSLYCANTLQLHSPHANPSAAN